MKYLVAILSALLVVVCAAEEYDPETPLPEYFKVCSRNDPNRDACIRDSLAAILPGLSDGYKPLDIPKLEPLHTPKFRVTNALANIKGTTQGKDNYVHGTTHAKVKAVRTKLTEDTLDMEVDLYYDKMEFEGNYKFDGGINLLQISSKGHFNITMIQTDVTWKVKGKLEERNGEKYMKIIDADMTPDPQDLSIYVSNILPDPELNNALLGALNQNWRSLYKEAQPILQTLWGPIIQSGMNSVFEKVPFRRLMPEN